MAVRENSPVICSIAFVEIVDYARMPVEAQMHAKERFNGLVARALSGVPATERIVLNTTQGVAVSFLASAEACLRFALTLRDAVATEGETGAKLRIGINAGPVRLVRDQSGQPNLVGDGMSVGQRIVGFAEADQILASATFHAAVSKLDPDYAQLFDFAGARTDAQLREHALYALNQRPTPVRSPQPRAPMPASALGRRASRAAVIPVLLRRPRLATALAVALILLTAVALRQAVQRSDALPPTPVAARPEAVAEPTPPISSAAPAARLPEASAATGTVRLTIVPWGEIYVDGEKVGVTPPLRELALKPGPHRIEIRNPGVASHVQAVHVSAGEEIRIRHRFD